MPRLARRPAVCVAALALLLLLLRHSRAGGSWLSRLDRGVADELAAAQAFVVKDEEGSGCRADAAGDAAGDDARLSDRRYLVCAGSVLTGRHVLTSASCIREATHVRHNVRAQLAVLVAPFARSAQLIGVQELLAHPGHVFDPRDPDHALHDVAVLRLACRISRSNLRRPEMPVRPFAEECAEGSCVVGVARRTGQLSFAMHQTRAIVVPKKLDHATKTSAGKKDPPRVNEGAADESDKGPSNREAGKVEEVEDEDEEGKKSRPRSSSHGASGCPHTGSPVMLDKTQYGIVSSSCDERQPGVSWRYADVFENLGWINSIIKPAVNQHQYGTNKPIEQCSSAVVYNLYLEFDCKDKCRRSSSRVCGLEGVSLPGIELPRCPGNQTESIAVGAAPRRRQEEATTESLEAVQERLKKMAYDAYLDRLSGYRATSLESIKSTPGDADASPLPDQVAALYRQFLEEHMRNR